MQDGDGNKSQFPDESNNSSLTQYTINSGSSKILKLTQELQRDYDLLSPGQVRQRLQHLCQTEMEEVQARKTALEINIATRLDEKNLQFKYELQKLKVNFEYETLKIEKTFKDNSLDVIKTLKIKQLDKLILIVSKLRQIQARSKNNEFNSFYDISVETGALA